MLELCGVAKLYSGFPAVNTISSIAGTGEVTGYLGPSGSDSPHTIPFEAPKR